MVASRMAPVASMTRKHAPNWRLATIRTSIIGFVRVISQGIMSTKATAQTVATPTMKLEPKPIVLQSAVEHDLQRTEKGHDLDEAEEIESGTWTPAVGLRLAQDQRDRRHREQAHGSVDQKAPVP